VLLMLDDTVPDGFETWAARYPRVVEVVSQEDNDRQAARERFRAYRARGCDPQSIDVGRSAP
jgi:DNA polymerase-3 subunit chi